MNTSINMDINLRISRIKPYLPENVHERYSIFPIRYVKKCQQAKLFYIF